MAPGRERLSYLRRLLFPPKCAGCGRLLEWQAPLEAEKEQKALCSECLRLWTSERLETCGICAKPVGVCGCMPLLMSEAKCRGFCKTVYYTPLRKTAVQNRMIWQIKQGNLADVHRFFAEELAPLTEQMLWDAAVDRSRTVLTYLPRSRRARLQTGTDQAQMLAHCLGKRLELPVCELLKRKRGSDRSQKNLSPKDRVKNAKRAYLPNVREDCRGKTVLLVDDIVTTGASMAVCARILRRMGAAEVFCVAVATDVANKDILPGKKT